MSPPDPNSSLLNDDYLWPFVGIRTIAALSIAIVVVIICFDLFPRVDTETARFFFFPTFCPQNGDEGLVCGRFLWADSVSVEAIRQYLQAAPVVLGVALLLVALFRWVALGRRFDRFNAAAAAAIASLALGPGVIVNVILKEFWGRPRPIATDLFGGPFPFVPVGHISNYCASNCSFVSGEVSGAFWLVCLASLAPMRYQTAAFAGSLLIAVTTAFLRLAFGGHYLSDVIVAGLISLLAFAILATALAQMVPEGGLSYRKSRLG